VANLWLHDLPVTFVGVGPYGTWVEDKLGNRHCVFAKGQAVYRCLLTTQQAMDQGFNDCPYCSWEKRAVKCGGSCDMRFTKAGCE